MALVLVPAFAPFSMQPKYLGHLTFAPTEVLIAVDVIAAAAIVLLRRSPPLSASRITGSPFLVPAVLFVVAASLSTVLANDRHLALHAFRERVIDPIAYIVLVLLFVRERVHWYWICAAIVVGGLVAGAIGLGQFVLQRDLSTVNGTGIKRVEALYGSPDNLGLLFDRVIPLWLVYALVIRATPARLLAGVAGILLVVPFFLTYSVGAWIGVGVAAGLVVSVMVPRGRWLVLMAILVIALAASVKHQAVTRAFQSGHANSTQTRIDVWRSALSMIRARPLTGIGPDNFQRYYAPTKTQDPYAGCAPGLGYMQPAAGSEPCLSHPHDEFLDYWLSSGLVGLVAFLWILVVFYRTAAQIWRRTDDRIVRAMVLGVGASMVASTLHGLIDNSYFLVDLSLFFWIFCGAVSWLDITVPARSFGRDTYLRGPGVPGSV